MQLINALVAGFGTGDGVAAYLPADWRVVTAAEGNGYVLALIENRIHDPESGWSFDGYVAPRLRSGNYGVREVDPDAGYLAVTAAKRLV